MLNLNQNNAMKSPSIPTVRNSIFALSLVAMLAIPAYDAEAQVIYQFTGASLSPTSGSLTNITAGAMTVANVAVSGTSTSQPSNTTAYASASAAYNYFTSQLTADATVNISTSSYFSFSLTSTVSGEAVNLTAFSFGARSIATAGAGPTSFELRSSADSFAGSIASGTFNQTQGSPTINYWYYYPNTGLNVTGAADTALTLRIYLLGANGANAGGSFRIDDLSISAASVVPEPSTAMFLSGGVAILLVAQAFARFKRRQEG